MASNRGSSSSHQAPSADAAQQHSLNPQFLAMPATELVAHLGLHHRAADFADTALVFADRERSLEEAETLVRLLEKRIERLLEGKRTLEDQLRKATTTEQVLRAQIQELQLQLPGGATGTRRRGGVGRGNVPRTSYRAQRMRAKAPALSSSGDESVGLDTSVDTTSDEEGDVGDDLPAARKTWQPRSLRVNASAGFRGSPLQAKQPRRRRRNGEN